MLPPVFLPSRASLATILVALVITSYTSAQSPSLRVDDPSGNPMPQSQTQVTVWGSNSSGQQNVPAGLVDAKSISASTTGLMVVRFDGTVVAWGGNPPLPAALGKVRQVDASNVIAVAVREDGTLTNWNDLQSGVRPAPSLDQVIAVSVQRSNDNSSSVAQALRADGSVVSWYGGTSTLVSQQPSITNAIAIASGNEHHLALLRDGTVTSWFTIKSQVPLDDRVRGQTSVPRGLNDVRAIAAGGFHSLALQEGGRIVGWGDNTAGQTTVPPTLTNVQSIAAGYKHSAALREDGTVVCWGSNSSGQCVPPPTLANVQAIALGGDHSAAISQQRGLIAFGAVTPGSDHTKTITLTNTGTAPLRLRGLRLDGPDSRTFSLDTLTLSSLSPGQSLVQIVHLRSDALKGRKHAMLIIDTDDPAFPSFVINLTGTVQAPEISIQDESDNDIIAQGRAGLVRWGRSPIPIGSLVFPTSVDDVEALTIWSNQSMRLLRSNGELEAIPDAQLLPDEILHNVAAIAQNSGRSLVLDSTGKVSEWPPSQYYRDGTVPNYLANVETIAASSNSSFAVRKDGTLEFWKYAPSFTAAPRKGLRHVREVASAGSQVAVLFNDGHVTSYEAGIPMTDAMTSPAGVRSLAAGASFVAALKQDGTVSVWGPNTDTTTVPAGLVNVQALACGSSHVLALKKDGTVTAWGSNSRGQTTVPTNLTDVRLIAASEDTSMALMQPGTEVDMGSVNVGQPQSRTFTLRNDGDADLLISDATVGGRDYQFFSLSLPTPQTLHAGQSTSFSVRCEPQHRGKLITIISLTTNDADESNFRLRIIAQAIEPELNVEQPAGFALQSDTSSVISLGRQLDIDSQPEFVLPPEFKHVKTARRTPYSFAAITEDGSVISSDADSFLNRYSAPIVTQGLHQARTLLPNYSQRLITEDGTLQSFAAVSGTLVFESLGTGFRDYAFTLGVTLNGQVRSAEPGDQPITPPARTLGTLFDIEEGVSTVTALRTNGSLVSWVANTSDQLSALPKNLPPIQAIAQTEHTLALTRKGEVLAWGDNAYGQADVPTGLTRVIAIAAGAHHSVALKDDGTVIAWGANNRDQCAIPQGLNGVESATAEGDFTTIVRSGGFFGTIALGKSADLTFTLSNTDQGTLTNLSATIDGPSASHFRIVSKPADTLAALSGTTSLTVRCTPSSPGRKNATLRLQSNDPDSAPFIVRLRADSPARAATPATVRGSPLTFGPLRTDRLTGLVVQTLTYRNDTPESAAGLRIRLSALASGVTVYGSSETDRPGEIEVLYSESIPAQAMATATLCYADPLRRTQASIQPSITVEALDTPEPEPASPSGTMITLRSLRYSSQGPLLEWNSSASGVYVIEYSDDGTTWRTAAHRLRAGSTRMLWIDRGQPETRVFTGNPSSRKYRVKRVL